MFQVGKCKNFSISYNSASNKKIPKENCSRKNILTKKIASDDGMFHCYLFPYFIFKNTFLLQIKENKNI
jgi:hypothetical protein